MTITIVDDAQRRLRAEEELAERDALDEAGWDDELMGDPDEYGEHYCVCQAEHGLEEIDTNQCDSCGRDIA